ncbi:MAG: polynucleotide adenylyltransferase [Sphingobium sp.]|nr:MAG: polynucleotide adenylyltransferase [Sphingobium sp.]
MTILLPDGEWRHRPGLDRLFATLGGGGAARLVGGAVRDGLLGLPVQDIDIATVHEPDTVVALLQAAGIKSVPTGIAHGTVTAVINGRPAEITTLRRDVATDGRRATIAFSTDWREDAARRDFTMNALYAEPESGAVHDYFGGVEDLRSGHVRFIGNATDRIAEDHLRILRYFRFLARFGNGAPDADAYAACVAQANSLMALSRERIADELLKLLGTADPVPALMLMIDGGILKPVMPEVDADGVARLRTLIGREAHSGVARAPLRRLAALLPPDARVGDAVSARLKLSNRARKRIALALEQDDSLHVPARILAYHIGIEGAVDRLLLDARGDPAQVRDIVDWTPPDLPVGGGALIARGMQPGPDIARALREVEAAWIAEGFPDTARTEAIADQIASKFQRARQ